jgi:hypothetical protein
MFSKANHKNYRLDKKTGLPIPLTSVEAYKSLQGHYSLKQMERFVRNFKCLFDTQSSVLRDLQKEDSSVDNQEFLDELTKTSDRLIAALKTHEPYSTLFGDLMKFKNQLQVILGYYQTQIETDQPVASDFVKNFKGVLPSARKVGLLSDSDSMELFFYTINFCANDVMRKDIRSISSFILEPFLEDHSKEVGFSYVR